MNDSPDPGAYSKAFESFVQDSDDLVGLIAYALYKQNIREASTSGRAVTQAGSRHPTQTELTIYREAAEGKLSTYAISAINGARSEIQEEGLRSDLGRVQSELEGSIARASSWRVALGVNLLAWIISLAITAVIAIAGLPKWLQLLSVHLNHD